MTSSCDRPITSSLTINIIQLPIHLHFNSVNPVTNVNIHRSLFQWSWRKCMIIRPCQNSLITLKCYSFLPRFFPSEPLSVSSIYFPYLVSYTTFTQLFDRDWINHGEWLTRAWRLSIEIGKTSSDWWAYRINLLDWTIKLAVRSLSNEI